MTVTSLLSLLLSAGVLACHIVATVASRNISEINGSTSLNIQRFRSIGQKHKLHHENPEYHIIFYINFVFCPLIILVNVLVLLTVGLVKCLHTPHDVMLAICSLVDLLVGVLFLPVEIVQHFVPISGRSKGLCEFTYMTSGIFSLSLTAYTLMSLERMVGVRFPFWYQRNVTCSKVVFIVAVVICTEVVIDYSLINMFIQFDETLPVGERCKIQNNFPHWYLTIFQPIFITVKLLLSLSSCVYVNIVARKHRYLIRSQCQTISQRRNSNSMETRSVIPIVCSFMFIILWVPKIVDESLHTSHTHLGSSQKVDIFLDNLLKINSFINPLLICLIKPLYRKSFKTILTTPPWRFEDLKNQLRENSYKSSLDSNPLPLAIQILSSQEMRQDSPESCAQSIDGGYIADVSESSIN